MKNIHVIPTDKPSRLHLYTDEKGTRPELCELEYSHTRNTQHIYITSDEEIKAKEYILIIRENLLIGKLGEVVLIESTKEGRTEYVRINGTRGWFASDVNYQKDWNYKKIILTTDQDLIKNGVQAIDDEFLEWFVKNPSCEWVELKNGVKRLNLDGEEVGFPDMSLYKIIIPKEETKQETLEEAKQRILDSNYMTKNDADIFEMGVRWQQKQNKNLYTEEDLREAFYTGLRKAYSLKKIVYVGKNGLNNLKRNK